nr:kinesin-like protein KIN-7D, mitochondrial [Tanacetum cinerariifolium]
NSVVKERQVLDVSQTAHDVPKEEPLVARLKQCFFPAVILACVNLARLPVLNVQFAGPRLQIEFLLSHLDICSLPPS